QMILKPPDRRNSADHVSLSSIFNCQKTEDHPPSKPHKTQTKRHNLDPTSPKGPTRQNRRHPAEPVGKTRTNNQTSQKPIKTVSPENRSERHQRQKRRSPSFDERLIRPPNPKRQHRK
ncbi:hypothetical protein, partial [Rhizobium rhizosphaerae]|uniref:hypothetical protein n=1 Tax=Xaviernesmea rhizosphaerae TaxID=1672749 RepID=UPI001AECE9C2